MRVLEEKRPASEAAGDTSLQPLKRSFSPLQHCKYASDLVVAVVRMPKGLWAGTSRRQAVQRLSRRSGRRVIDTLQTDDEWLFRQELDRLIEQVESGRRAKKGEEQRNHSGDRAAETLPRPASRSFRESRRRIYFSQSSREFVEPRCSGDRGDSARNRSGEDSVVRLARVSARTGYESSPSRGLRQSHSADSASRGMRKER